MRNIHYIYIHIYIYICIRQRALVARCGVLESPLECSFAGCFDVLQGATPPLSHVLRGPPDPKNHQKINPTCKSVYDGFFDGFWSQLGLQNRPKSHRKCIQNRIIFECVFASILHRFCIDFGGRFGSKIHQKMSKKGSKNL